MARRDKAHKKEGNINCMQQISESFYKKTMMYLYYRLRYENIKFTSFKIIPIANKDYDSWVAVFNAKIQNTFF